MHTGPVSTVLPSGTPARAGKPLAADGALADDGGGTARSGRLAAWPSPLRVPLEVSIGVGRTWEDAGH